jgi:hypothetical protein
MTIRPFIKCLELEEPLGAGITVAWTTHRLDPTPDAQGPIQ